MTLQGIQGCLSFIVRKKNHVKIVKKNRKYLKIEEILFRRGKCRRFAGHRIPIQHKLARCKFPASKLWVIQDDHRLEMSKLKYGVNQRLLWKWPKISVSLIHTTMEIYLER